MTVDRRNDLGGKLSWLLIAAVVAGFSSFSWVEASKGEDKADKALAQLSDDKVHIAVLEANLLTINNRLDEIKALIKAIH